MDEIVLGEGVGVEPQLEEVGVYLAAGAEIAGGGYGVEEGREGEGVGGDGSSEHVGVEGEGEGGAGQGAEQGVEDEGVRVG